jgi:hypothetical protein
LSTSQRTLGLFVIWFFAYSGAAIAAERIEVPIKTTVLTDGEIRYSVPIRIGDAGPIDAVLDTGSTGLRVLSTALPERAYSASDQTSIMGFNSGDRLIGVIASAVVKIGQASTDAAIPFQIVRSVECLTRLPHCPASRVRFADYRLGGNGVPRQGYGAIFGIKMRSADGVNPLVQAGANSWIVTLPRPGETRPGMLILNPASGDRSGYTLFPVNGGAFFHDHIAGCLVRVSPPKQVCGPTELDTGASELLILSPNASDLSGWKAGQSLEIVFKNPEGAELSTKSVVDSNRLSHIFTIHLPEATRIYMSAGLLPYFAFSVLYDAENDVIGLKRR